MTDIKHRILLDSESVKEIYRAFITMVNVPMDLHAEMTKLSILLLCDVDENLHRVKTTMEHTKEPINRVKMFVPSSLTMEIAVKAYGGDITIIPVIHLIGTMLVRTFLMSGVPTNRLLTLRYILTKRGHCMEVTTEV